MPHAAQRILPLALALFGASLFVPPYPVSDFTAVRDAWAGLGPDDFHAAGSAPDTTPRRAWKNP